MKKRSMLAIASLATGFVVAAITPSHAVDTQDLGAPNAGDTLGALDHTLTADSPVMDDTVLGQGD